MTKIQEQNDVLLEIGKEGKEGDKAFKEYADKKDKESKDKRDKVLDRIDSQPKIKPTYNEFLANLLIRRLGIVDWQPGWTYQVAPTQRGVVMEMKSPDNRIFRSAFKSTSDSMADLNAIDMFALRAENTIDAMTKIWLPNQQKMN